jgi:hypothetical protein
MNRRRTGETRRRRRGKTSGRRGKTSGQASTRKTGETTRRRGRRDRAEPAGSALVFSFYFKSHCMYVGTHPRKAGPSLGKYIYFTMIYVWF